MKIKISTLLIIILIITTIIGVFCGLQPKNMGEMIAERNISNETIKSELEGKIDIDLQRQEQEFEEKINMYISEIYFGTDTYLTEFKDINLANEQWIWECAYSNLNNVIDEVTTMIVKKEEIEESAKQIFGDNLQKEFPEEGLEFWLEPESDGYFYTGASIESDFYNNCEILSYKKINNNITVDIVEYKYNEIFLGEPTEFNLYKINSDEVVKSYSLDTNTSTDNYNDFLLSKHYEAEEFVKENPQLFSTGTITLEYDEQNDLLYIKSFERQ